MQVVLTRDSVSMADDCSGEDSTHRHVLDVPDDADTTAMLAAVVSSGWLPGICGGLATWSVVSRDLIAIVAQQEEAPRLMRGAMVPDRWVRVDGAVRLHFNYHAQIDPELVERVLYGFEPAADFFYTEHQSYLKTLN